MLPLHGHRFLISESDLEVRPILSIYGSDIIVYGWDLRTYLLRELQDHLDIYEKVYNQIDNCYYTDDIEGYQEILKSDFVFEEKKEIPYWKEMILYWSSGWLSFGLEYPLKENLVGRPIMKTYIPDDEENKQKIFTAFE